MLMSIEFKHIVFNFVLVVDKPFFDAMLSRIIFKFVPARIILYFVLVGNPFSVAMLQSIVLNFFLALDLNLIQIWNLGGCPCDLCCLVKNQEEEGEGRRKGGRLRNKKKKIHFVEIFSYQFFNNISIVSSK